MKLLALVEPHTAGDPMSDAKWLNCRLADLQEQLNEQGQVVSRPVISRLLKAHDYHLQVNVKALSGPAHPQRNAQFEHIREQRSQHLAAAQPVLSVDSKKKELIGDFKNAGRTWSQEPELVNVHDFAQDALGKAVPYGLYDVQNNQGTVYLGQSADTPTFAVANIAHWCATERLERFPQATELLIEAAPCGHPGGSNGARSRVWKQQLQEQVADRFGLTVTVCHYPTGTSKWNPIEHRLFSEISKTWAGCPLRTFELALHYIRQTKTQTGLKVQAHRVTQVYATGVKVSDAQMDALKLQPHDVCPQWNYTIRPRTNPNTS